MAHIFENCSALTGSIATGKTTVSNMFKELGAHVVDTDLIAREIVEPGHPALNKIEKEFGREIVKPDGTLNREKLRIIIIDDQEKRKLLNSITHPYINSIAFQRAEEYLNSDNNPVLIDIPLLFEAGSDKLFSTIILVHTPVDLQVKRLMERDNLNKEEAEKTLTFQMNIDDKKSSATYIIDNSGDVEKTRRQVSEIYEVLINTIAGH